MEMTVLNAWTGDDRLYGSNGDDYLNGAAGADLLHGGLGQDTVDYFWSEGVDIDLGAGTASGGEAEGDTLVSIEHVRGSQGNDTLTGDGGDNSLRGYAGDDLLGGGAGADTLWGEGGADTLTGGDGQDVFVFETVAENQAVVMDFTEGDRLDLAFVESFDDVSQRITADGLVVEAGDFQVLLAGVSEMLTEEDFLM